MLFRDVGPEATALFLQSRLRRLSGRSPVVYLRDHRWIEPYTDHEAIGRLVVLRPDLVEPWATGLPHVYVASVRHAPSAETIGFVPGHVPLAQATASLQGVRDPAALREALGGSQHDEAVRETLHRLQGLLTELQAVERLAEPLRRALQSGTPAQREAVRRWMERTALDEADLCSAWHHLPRARRAQLIEALPSFEGAP